MQETTHGVGQRIEFSVPNVGGGPERYTETDIESGSGVALLLLLRNHYCAFSRKIVQELQASLAGFEAEHVTVAAVLPDTAERASVWGRRYDLSFPLLADPASPGKGAEDPAFDAFADLSRWMPQTPGLALLDTRGDAPTVRQIYSGARPQDCPSVSEMLDIAVEAKRDPRGRPRSMAD